jgi:hypothetical protein
MRISETKIEAMGICENNNIRLKTKLDGKITEQVSEFKYLENTISFENKDREFKTGTYNNMNRLIRRSFGKETSRKSQIRLHNFTSKAALTYGSEY